ncbi:MAG: signal recognition particle-docking protein FtsY, partial [bacterium]|nr:signal recognition particle-docking protein FtsY [bacterium]
SQVRVFTDAVGCDGLVITKLDGTAKGGVLIAIAEELEIPVEYIGIGEGVEDIQQFDSSKYVEALFE